MPRLGEYLPAALRPYARGVKRWARALRPATTDAPLRPEDCRGELLLKAYAVTFQQGETLPCPVRVTNHGQAVWSSGGTHPVRLNFR